MVILLYGGDYFAISLVFSIIDGDSFVAKFNFWLAQVLQV